MEETSIKNSSNVFNFTSHKLSPFIENEVNFFDGPLSGPLSKRVRALKSSYTDQFDWSIYDKLADRYSENPPRGGVIFKTTFKLVNHHSSCSKCHYSFEIDTYGRGCIHNCQYCYAKEQLTSHGYWNRPMPFPVDLAEVRKIFHTVFETDKPSKWREIMEKRVPVRIGSMSDSFMWIDEKYGVTRELLNILKFYKYPYVVFTRSDLIAKDNYIEALDKNLASIQFSISGNNEKLTKLIEPGAPSPKRRFAALKKLREQWFWTTVRVNPFFPMFPDGYYTNTQAVVDRFGSVDSIPSFPLFGWDFFDQLEEAKVPSVIAGVVRLSPISIKAMSESTGIDLSTFFAPEVMKGSADKHYSDKEVAHYYRLFSTEAKKRKINFSTCYIGNGIKDYFQYQQMWDNKKDCCDIVGNVTSFNKTSQGINWEERLRHATSKALAKLAMDAENSFENRLKTSPPELTL